MSKATPKINRKRTTAAIICTVVVAGVAYVMFTLVNKGPDIDFPHFPSKDFIAAVKDNESGSQAVIIKADGSILESPGYPAGAQDLSPIWTANGQRLLFISDRDKGEPSIFRWKPENGEVERRSLDRRSKTDLNIGAPGVPGDDQPLFAAGGIINTLDYSKKQSHQILPPNTKDIMGQGGGGGGDEGEGGSTGQIDQMYGPLGSSFKKARWLLNKTALAATMRRDVGETLIIQALAKDPQGNIVRPQVVATAEHVDFDVSDDSTIAYTINNLQILDPTQIPPEMKKNGKFTPPFINALYFLKGDQQPSIIVATQKETVFFGPKISPKGDSVLVGVASADGDRMTPTQMVLFPLEAKAASKGKGITGGVITDFNWSSDGSKIVFTRRTGDKSSIFTINADGSGEQNITGDKGNFHGGSFSPYVDK